MSGRLPDPVTAEWFVAKGIIDRETKIDRYLLSPTHRDGRNKLRLWRGVFGIGEEDGELLERLIREQLTQAVPEERPAKIVREPEERTISQWQLLIPRFRGPNGRTAPVKTGWAFDPLIGRPHLTNAFPEAR